MVQSVERSVSLNVPLRTTLALETLRRTQSYDERKIEDKQVMSYLSHEHAALDSLNQWINELKISPKCREFWFPNEEDRSNIETYFSDEEALAEWESKYNSLLRHQVTQRDTRFLGMRRRIKALLQIFSTSRPAETNENALDIYYLEAWINDLSEKSYAQENLEMKLVYGIDLKKFKEEMKMADKNHNGVLSKDEFIQMMTNYHKRNNYQKSSAWERAWNAIAYADTLSCSPLALGILGLCFLNIAIYIRELNPNRYTPFCSKWIYNPNRRYEFWRFLTSSFMHAEPLHLINNMILLVLVGVPLEMYHSTWRIIFVYVIGCISGSLLVSVTDKKRALAGASGGVSSLAAAHVADIALNWTEDTIIFRHRLRTNRPAQVIRSESVRIGRLCIIGAIISLDVYNCLRQRYGSSRTGEISYISHIGGAIFGFLVGYLVLHHHFFRKNNNLIRFLVLIGSLFAWGFLIMEHLLNKDEFPPLDYCKWETFLRECQDKCYTYTSKRSHCNITYC